MLPERLAGVWQEDGSGYRVELRIPGALRPQAHRRRRLRRRRADAGSAGAARAVLPTTIAPSSTLAALEPDHLRARIVDPDAWLIADAGVLQTQASAPPEADGWFGRLVYHSLIAPALTGSSALTGDAPRLDAAEVWQALSGVAATSWRAGDAGDGVVLAAAVPLHAAGEMRGALVLEQANRALPLLANRALFGLAGATLAALAIAGLILLLFGASLSFRIRRLRNAAERATRTSGRLHGPMPLADADDELGDLARSFGKLFDEVGAYTDYLRTLASKLSHELNTPLAIVKSSLDNLDHQALPADARAYAARARDGAERLGKIVRAMSEAGRIERAIAAAEAEDFDLPALVAGCAAGYRALAGGRDLRVRIAGRPMPFHGAPELIAQALDKLFDNARSFTPDDGWIELSLEPAQSRRNDPYLQFWPSVAGGDAGSLVRFAGQRPRRPAHERTATRRISASGFMSCGWSQSCIAGRRRRETSLPAMASNLRSGCLACHVGACRNCRRTRRRRVDSRWPDIQRPSKTLIHSTAGCRQRDSLAIFGRPHSGSARMISQDEFAALAAQGYNRIPVVREVLSDLDTPLSVYLKLADGAVRVSVRIGRGRRELGSPFDHRPAVPARVSHCAATR